MADVVTTQILENGPRFVVSKFTSVSDGTGEAGVVKLDATATGPYGVFIGGRYYYPQTYWKVVEIKYSVASMALRIQWVASTNSDMLVLQATDHWGFLDDRGGFAGLSCPPASAVPGITGSIAFTTIGAASNSSYTIIMKLTKGVPQS